MLRPACFFILIARTVCCQPADLSLPGLGYVLDTSGDGQIRPITGIPGAALVGTPLRLGFSAARMATSSRAALALASNETTGDLMIVREGQAQIFDQGSGAPSFAISATGQAAVSSRAAEVVTVKIWDNLERPAASEWKLLSPCPSPKWAISDDGRRTVAACAGSGAVIWSDGQAQTAPVNLVGFSFLPDALSGAGVDAAGDLYWLDEAGAWSLLRSRWVDQPAENFAVLATSRWVVAVAGSTILRLDRGTSESERFDCSCPVTGLYATPVNGMVRLNQAAGLSAVYLFDAGRGRFWFVPSAEASQ